MMKLSVEGMTCSGCVNAVTRIITGLDDQSEVQVSLASGLVETNARVAAAELIAALHEAGFPAHEQG
ncbi:MULTISPECIES: heavy-metal-associated domain-containing protein [unclassified Oceanobacter]|jgi:copper chaperone|uniref:heavy-metal-associated domain-containing protein n=1 Tax=unclassified Oceanobacter TaxID=2620260 RepID=UPI0026E417D2|nr:MULTISPECIES: heavy-metal-associated domain-containing protein [unclassified Oceanobacter]MDO6804288.1 heavy-metal-associated domain-containing protein [Wenyingzhuangia sp. 1_MG-2023]MDO6682087.1 heavy-metal-associated domain-containing protein [Oceanobacter sp. 5_MG-2023]MDP2505518.1 heavy-metal-associated domain-containing protein [Oceanobacter sp. 3_MG-2023]MDP2547093.1 heavy-metal-associated domain-containing protein [Oceanobacter sp. 4_MG-2023]MDP2609718.1 heavy-metal-associated domain